MSEAARDLRRTLSAGDDPVAAEFLVRDVESERGYSVSAYASLLERAWDEMNAETRRAGVGLGFVSDRFDEPRRQGLATVEMASANGADAVGWALMNRHAENGAPNVGLAFCAMPGSRLVACGAGLVARTRGISARWPEFRNAKRVARLSRHPARDDLVTAFLASARRWALTDEPDRVLLPWVDALAAFSLAERHNRPSPPWAEHRERTVSGGGRRRRP